MTIDLHVTERRAIAELEAEQMQADTEGRQVDGAVQNIS